MLTEQLKDICSQNIVSLKKEIKEETRKWKMLLGRINTVKIAILQIANLQIKWNPLQNLSKIFHWPWKDNTQIYMEKQKT